MVFIRLNEKIEKALKQYEEETSEETDKLIEKNKAVSLATLRKVHSKLLTSSKNSSNPEQYSFLPKTCKEFFTFEDMVYTIDQKNEIKEIELPIETIRLREHLSRRTNQREYRNLMKGSHQHSTTEVENQ